MQELLADTESRGFGVKKTLDDHSFDVFMHELRDKPVDVEQLSAEQNPRAQYLDRLVNMHLLGYL